MSNFPKLADGSALAVGSHRVTVLQYLSEGGFAHIYKVKVDAPHNASDIACLKRVIVPNKSGLNQMRKEVDVMKSLRNARRIVRYYDSHAERLEDGTYQVLVLMELCPNGSLLDYMNQKIRTKLAEPEILKIMLDISIGIYEMHKLNMIHRDIKIENVLIDADRNFELCDFGSTSPPLMPAQDQAQLQALSHDILYQTTPQYRLPEMVDLYRGLPINEKSDIWAFGCFLYKLCFYTTPFESNGEIAILHASFQFPPQPVYSGDLNNLIIIMLQENPAFRPNIFQVITLLAKLMAIDPQLLDVADIYQQGEYNFLALSEYQQHRQKVLAEQHELSLSQLRTTSTTLPERTALPPAEIEVIPSMGSRSTLRGTVEETADVVARPAMEDPEISDSSSSLSDLNTSLPDLDNIENIAERYPSLEDIVVEKPVVIAQTPTLGASSANEKDVRTSAPVVGTPFLSTHQQKADAPSTEYTNKETWQKQSSGPITEAELLADDIFSTHPDTSIPKVKSTHSMDASVAESYSQSPHKTRHGPKSAPLTTRIDPVGGAHEVSLLDISNEESVLRRQSIKSISSALSIPSNDEMTVTQPIQIPNVVKDAQPMPQANVVSSVSPLQNPNVVSAVQQISTPNTVNVALSLPTPNAANNAQIISKPNVVINVSQIPESFAVPPSSLTEPTLSPSQRPPQPLHIHDPLRKDANPWGPYRRLSYSPSQAPLVQDTDLLAEAQPLSLVSHHNRNSSHEPTFIAQSEQYAKPQDVVADSLASLQLGPNPTARTKPFMESSNLIDLESEEIPLNTPKSTAGASTKLKLPPHSRQNLSTFMMGSDLEFKADDLKPSHKKRISSIHSVGLFNFQEETIDFASDDESPENQSRMSRMSIRKSLKLSRKSSELKRSDSTSSDHRKLHSLFGGNSIG